MYCWQIRAFLLIAYFFLLVEGALGLPNVDSWTHFNGSFAVGIVAFAAAGCLVHTAGLVLLLWDERSIRLSTDDEEQLWRFVYRRSGMNRLEFQACLRLGTCVSLSGSPPNQTEEEMYCLVWHSATLFLQ